MEKIMRENGRPMANSFILELDTTGPRVAISAPGYTTPDIENEVYVNADEALAPFQNIYLVDSEQVRHDFIFQYEGTRFYGIVKLADCAAGIATLYVQVKDEVENLSNLATKSINLLVGGDIIVTGRTKRRKLHSKQDVRRVAWSVTGQRLIITNRTQRIATAVPSRRIKIKTLEARVAVRLRTRRLKVVLI